MFAGERITFPPLNQSAGNQLSSSRMVFFSAVPLCRLKCFFPALETKRHLRQIFTQSNDTVKSLAVVPVQGSYCGGMKILQNPVTHSMRQSSASRSLCDRCMFIQTGFLQVLPETIEIFPAIVRPDPAISETKKTDFQMVDPRLQIIEPALHRKFFKTVHRYEIGENPSIRRICLGTRAKPAIMIQGIRNRRNFFG